MNIEKFIHFMIWAGTTLVMVGLMWTIGTYFAETVSDHKVITPKPGVECVVVSRMFNTSVDCWKVEG